MVPNLMGALEENANYYEVLELTSEASPQEIREAYLKLKSAYNKDSPALYALLSREETDQMREQIEKAYHTLSDPVLRKEYDRHHGISEIDPFIRTPPPQLQSRRIISLNPIPGPDLSSGEDMLIPPTTEITPLKVVEPPVPINIAPMQTPQAVSPEPKLHSDLDNRISQEVDWSGGFIKEVRTARNLSIEELSDFTKISKNYIRAIEDEDFSKLPAPVYLRGFLIQLSKKMKLPAETVASSYLARYRQSGTTKT